MRETLKNKILFHGTIILVATVTIVVSIQGYWEFTDYMQRENEEKMALQQQLESLSDEIAENKESSQRAVSQAQSEATNARAEALKAQEDAKKAQEEAENATVTIVEDSSNQINLPNIIDFWDNYVVKVSCSFPIGDLTGSGTVIKEDNGEIRVMTNKHVARPLGQFPTSCSFFNHDQTIVILDPPIYSHNELDFAMISLDKETVRKFVKYALPLNSQAVHSDSGSCEAIFGDEILTIGFPFIGPDSFRTYTVTKGIISSYDYPYYITDAKIDRGNSGGIAVLLRPNGQDCLLGVPTSANVGAVESLGHILDLEVVFDPTI